MHQRQKDEHQCRRNDKRVEVQCKQACSDKPCIRGCRKANNLAQQVCGDLAVLCYADCAGVDLTPTTTTGAP